MVQGEGGMVSDFERRVISSERITLRVKLQGLGFGLYLRGFRIRGLVLEASQLGNLKLTEPAKVLMHGRNPPGAFRSQGTWEFCWCFGILNSYN